MENITLEVLPTELDEIVVALIDRMDVCKRREKVRADAGEASMSEYWRMKREFIEGMVARIRT